MKSSLSLASYAERGFAVLPIGARDLEGAPSVCISLATWGEMQGDGEGRSNRRRLYRELGIEEKRLRSLKQVHSRWVHVASEIPEGSEPDGDGLVTSDPHQCLSVRVADCYPVFLFDRRSGAFAVVHSGWKGTGIVVEALSRMRRLYGSRARDVAALLGPGIRSCCYDVPADRAELFRERFGERVVDERDGKRFLDLAAANLLLLERAGVTDITEVADCTACSPFLGSFRRQGPHDYLHMLALIGYFR